MTISKEEQARVDEAVAKLLEHFDSIRIFVTRHNGQESETESYDSGGGLAKFELNRSSMWNNRTFLCHKRTIPTRP
jgi:hypothetical protein